MAQFTVSLLLKMVDQATAPLRAVTGALGGLRGAAKTATNGFAMFGLAADGVRTASSLITAPLRLINDAIVEPTAKYESFLTQLETTEHSAEKARQALAWIKDFAKATPYNVDEVTRAFVRLRAQGVEATDGTLRVLGDASGAFGKSLVDGVEALTDALTGENERLKEFGITASTNAKANSVTYSWMEAGKQVSRTVDLTDRRLKQSVLLGAFDANFHGGMERLSRTWKGMISNLEDAWEDFLVTIGNSGFLDLLKEQLSTLLATIGEMARSGELKQLAEGLGRDLAGAARTIIEVMPEAGRAFRFVGDVIGAVRREVDLAEADWNQLANAVRGFIWEVQNAWIKYLEFNNRIRSRLGLSAAPTEIMPPKPGTWDGGRGADDSPGGAVTGGGFGGRFGDDRIAGGAGQDTLSGTTGRALPSLFRPAGAASAAPASRPATGQIVVRFENPPPGLRVKRVEADGVDLSADLGWVMR